MVLRGKTAGRRQTLVMSQDVTRMRHQVKHRVHSVSTFRGTLPTAGQKSGEVDFQALSVGGLSAGKEVGISTHLNL